MKAIVIGAAGFIGNALAKKLISNNWEVIAIDNLSQGSYSKLYSLKEECTVGEISIQHLSMYSEAFPDMYNVKGADYVFHFGSPSSGILFQKDSNGCKDETISGWLAARKLADSIGAKFVFPSTSSLYGTLNDYARTKVQLESLSELFNLDALILRIFAGYGETEGHKDDYASIVYQFCKQAVNGEEIIVFGDGTQSRDFIYIDDIVEAILQLVIHGHTGITDVGTGITTSFNNIIKEIELVLNRRIKVKYIPNETKNYLVTTQMQNNEIFNFTKPQTSIRDGIRKIIESEQHNITK